MPRRYVKRIYEDDFTYRLTEWVSNPDEIAIHKEPLDKYLIDYKMKQNGKRWAIFLKA